MGMGVDAAAAFFTRTTGLIAVASTHHGDPIQHILADYSDGARCLFLGAVTKGAARCTTAWQDVLAFSLPGVAFAVSQFMVLKYASASTYFLLLGLELPLEAVGLSLRCFMGSFAADFHVSLMIGILIAIFGLLTWSYAEAQMPQPHHCTLNIPHPRDYAPHDSGGCLSHTMT